LFGTYFLQIRYTLHLKKVPKRILVILDEAYIEFAENKYQTNTSALIKKYSNLLITRTFSKLYGLASFRIGYGIGNSSIIKELHRVRQPFNVTGPTLAAANYALQNTTFIKKTLKNNKEQKKVLENILKEFGFTPSNTDELL
jgi:histidinol-phosphate aminotransferase